MVAKGSYLCEVFEKKVPIIIQAQMGKLTNCIFLLFDGTNVHVPIPIAILATAILLFSNNMNMGYKDYILGIKKFLKVFSCILTKFDAIFLNKRPSFTLFM